MTARDSEAEGEHGEVLNTGWSLPSRFSEPSIAARMFAGAVEDGGAATRVRDDAELGRQHHLFATVLDRPSDQLFVLRLVLISRRLPPTANPKGALR